MNYFENLVITQKIINIKLISYFIKESLSMKFSFKRIDMMIKLVNIIIKILPLLMFIFFLLNS